MSLIKHLLQVLLGTQSLTGTDLLERQLAAARRRDLEMTVIRTRIQYSRL